MARPGLCRISRDKHSDEWPGVGRLPKVSASCAARLVPSSAGASPTIRKSSGCTFTEMSGKRLCRSLYLADGSPLGTANYSVYREAVDRRENVKHNRKAVARVVCGYP